MSGRMETAQHLTSPTVDAFVSEKLAGADRSRAEAHLTDCARCRDDVARSRAAQADFCEIVLPRTLARVRSRLSSPAHAWHRRFRSPWTWLAGVATAAAALLLFVRTPARDDILTKGGASLRVVARRDGKLFPVADGTRLRAGDELRFVVSAGARWLLVASIDGDGQASVYYPFDGVSSASIDAAGKRLELPGSIVLDQARGPERIFALFSDTPLPSARVKAELVRLGAGGADAIRNTRALPDEAAEQLSIVVEKEGR